MEIITIPRARVIEVLVGLVSERPHYVYDDGDERYDDACRYAAPNEEGGIRPSCGIGELLFRINPALLEAAHHFDPGMEIRPGSGEYRLNGLGVRALGGAADSYDHEVVLFTVDGDILQGLCQFQWSQDNDIEWDSALNAFFTAIPETR